MFNHCLILYPEDRGDLIQLIRNLMAYIWNDEIIEDVVILAKKDS